MNLGHAIAFLLAGHLDAAIEAASGLEAGLRAGRGADPLAGAHRAVRQSCIDCHRQHRDRR